MKSVINLIRTPQGFCLAEADNEVNKSSSKPSKDKSYSMSKSRLFLIKSLFNKILLSTPIYPIRNTITTNTS